MLFTEIILIASISLASARPTRRSYPLPQQVTRRQVACQLGTELNEATGNCDALTSSNFDYCWPGYSYAEGGACTQNTIEGIDFSTTQCQSDCNFPDSAGNLFSGYLISQDGHSCVCDLPNYYDDQGNCSPCADGTVPDDQGVGFAISCMATPSGYVATPPRSDCTKFLTGESIGSGQVSTPTTEEVIPEVTGEVTQEVTITPYVPTETASSSTPEQTSDSIVVPLDDSTPTADSPVSTTTPASAQSTSAVLSGSTTEVDSTTGTESTNATQSTGGSLVNTGTTLSDSTTATDPTEASVSDDSTVVTSNGSNVAQSGSTTRSNTATKSSTTMDTTTGSNTAGSSDAQTIATSSGSSDIATQQGSTTTAVAAVEPIVQAVSLPAPQMSFAMSFFINASMPLNSTMSFSTNTTISNNGRL